MTRTEETLEKSSADMTTELSHFVSGLEYNDLTEEEIRAVERSFVDIIGVTLAGFTRGVGSSVTETLGVGPASNRGASLFDRSTARSIPDASFINATAGHTLDFDDGSSGLSGHPSVPMVAPLIAVAEVEEIRVRDLIAAYIAGFETQCYLASPILPLHYEAGWHATSTLGTFGAAAAVSNLLGLDTPKTANALNIAASMPAGLKRNFGTKTKPIHAGQAARSGVTAALLARDGVDANPQAIEGQNGFLELYTGSKSPDLSVLPNLSADSAVLDHGINIKPYPSCTFTHAGVAATLEIVRDQGVSAENVDQLDVSISEGADDVLGFATPTSRPEAKFSMHYCLSFVVQNKAMGLEAFEADAITNRAVKEMMSLVNVTVDKKIPYSSLETTVIIRTTNGNSFTRTIEAPPGTPDNPLPEEDLRCKYLHCAGYLLNQDSARETFDWLNSLRDQKQVKELIRLLDQNTG